MRTKAATEENIAHAIWSLVSPRQKSTRRSTYEIPATMRANTGIESQLGRSTVLLRSELSQTMRQTTARCKHPNPNGGTRTPVREWFRAWEHPKNYQYLKGMPGAGIEPAWGCPRGILSRVEGPDNTARYDTIRHKNNDLRPSSNSTFAVLCGIVPQVLGTNWAQSGFTPSASSSPRTAGNRASARKGHGRIAMDRVPNEVRIGGTVPKRGPGPQEHRK